MQVRPAVAEGAAPSSAGAAEGHGLLVTAAPPSATASRAAGAAAGRAAATAHNAKKQRIQKGQHAPAAVAPAARVRGRGGRQQAGMRSFFSQTAKCLSCRRVLPEGVGVDAAAPARALCDDCSGEEGRWAALHVAALLQEGCALEELGAAHSVCRVCHSGGQLGRVVCENGECPVVYGRISAPRRAAEAQHKLARLDA